jgi:hypothetical protein
MQVENTVAASAEELVDWEKYKAEAQIKSIPIPYIFATGGVNVAGVFNLEDPVENSSTDGTAIGAIIGVYRLDKNNPNVKLYDPTGNILRLNIELNFVERVLKARICNRKWNGSWNCSGYATLASW